MKAHYSIKNIAAALDQKLVTTEKQAARGDWDSVTVSGKGRGGKVKLFVLDTLPASVRVAIKAHEFKNRVPKAATPNVPVHEMDEQAVELLPVQEKNALAKADLVRLWKGAGEKAAWGKKKEARAEFVASYNAGIIHSDLFETVGKTSGESLKRWEKKTRREGVKALADCRGYCRRGKRGVSDEEKMALIRVALNPNRPPMSEVIRLCRKVMNEMKQPMTKSEDTYRRWLNGWKKKNYDTWVFYREGYKAWNDQVADYIERNYELIEVGDVLVADGHTLNFQTINPTTGKPCRMTLLLWYDMKSNFPLGWELMPTEDTKSIASAFRRAILRLGKLPKVVYLDNGKAFRSKFFKGTKNFDEAGFSGLYTNLNIAVCHAWAYHGQSKTIERFFGTMAEMERRMLTYVGTSIEKKPPRMDRGERLHRQVHEKITEKVKITLEQTHKAIAWWFDEYAARPQGSESRMAGQRPVDLFEAGRGPGVNPELLRHFMMAEKISAIRRNGIRFCNKNYYHPELYGRTHSVLIRYDLQNPESIYVYDTENGRFLCEATEKIKVHPMATYLGTDEDRAELARQIEQKRSLGKQTMSSAKQFLEDEILPECRRELERQGLNLTGPVEEEAKLIEATVMTDEDKKKIMAEVEKMEAEALQDDPEVIEAEFYEPEVEDENENEWRLIEKMNDMDRMYKLIEFEVRGVLMPIKWQSWMKYYEETTEYAIYKSHFTEHKRQKAEAYGAVK